jgi:hypothetical protein
MTGHAIPRLASEASDGDLVLFPWIGPGSGAIDGRAVVVS